MLTVICYILGFGVNVLSNVVIYIILASIIKPKVSANMIIFVLVLELYLQVFLKSYVYTKAWQVDLSAIFLQILVVIIFFEGKWYEKMLAFVVSFVNLLIADGFTSSLVFGYLGMDYEVIIGYTQRSMLIRTLTLVIEFIVGYATVIILKPVKHVIFEKRSVPLFGLFLTQAATIFLFCTMLFRQEFSLLIVNWSYVFMFLFVDIYLIQTIGEMELRHKSQERLEYMQQRDENVRQYYRQLTSKFRDTADLRREYEEKLNQVYEKLGFEREAEKQELSANQVAATAEREEQNHLGVREIADKIIETKTAEMEAKDISYDVEMEFPDDLDMELIDLSSLLNNLFDNAMEAVEFCHAELKDTGEMRSEYPQIKGVTYQEGDAFVIDVENVKSSRQKVVEVNKHYRTSKQDSTGHGYGLQIVERIAKKYRGEMKVSYKKDSFRNKVLIRAI